MRLCIEEGGEMGDFIGVGREGRLEWWRLGSRM